MSRRLPPFPALRAFEAAARLKSFKDAAEELCVTPSAISHQVRSLEDFIERPLFARGTRGVELTRAGQLYLQDVGPILDSLEASTRVAAGEFPSKDLRVKMTEGFCKRWLMPRLSDFFELYPDIDIVFETGLPPTEFQNGALDMVIHWEDSPVEGAVVEPLMSSTRVPVCSRDFLDRNPDLSEPKDLLQHTLLRDEVGDGWREWFEVAGVKTVPTLSGPLFAHCELSMTAAQNGLGIGLAYTAMVTKSIAAGDLIPLFDIESAPRVIYSVAYEQHRRTEPTIIAFRDWLFEQIMRDEMPGMISRRYKDAAQ